MLVKLNLKKKTIKELSLLSLLSLKKNDRSRDKNLNFRKCIIDTFSIDYLLKRASPKAANIHNRW